MKIKKLNDNAIIPTKSHELDCGLDLYLCDDLCVSSFSTVCVGLGLSFEIPEGFAGILIPRSSITKKGLIVHNAIVDPGYKGEVHLIVTNCSKSTLIFGKGDRLCSLVCFNILNPTINPEDNRGSNGLGSSGK